MKKIVLLVAALFVVNAYAERISGKAWNALREIHARYTQDVEKLDWKPQDADTDTFLENNIQNYVLGLTNKCISLENENNQLKTELAQIRSSRDTYLKWTVALGIVLFLVFTVPLAFIAATRKKGTAVLPSSNSGCPRCGSPIDPATQQCTKCGTHI